MNEPNERRKTTSIRRREVVQIAVTAIPEMEADVVYALCNDGSIWCNIFGHDGKWQRLPDIPQDDDVRLTISHGGKTVRPVNDVKKLSGTWPGDADDGFEQDINEHRHE